MRTDDDRRGVLLHILLPPPERLAAHHAARVPTERTAADLLRRFVDVAHHQEKKISNPKRVPLPGSYEWKRPLCGIHFGEFGVLARGIDPFPPPPGVRFIETATVVIARKIVDLFATMP